MKKYVFFFIALGFLSCDNEMEDMADDYIRKPKLGDLKGFWQLEGHYEKKSKNIDPVSINNGTIAGIGKGGMLYFDDVFMRFLSKSNGSDVFQTSGTYKFYWYSEKQLIKSMYQHYYNKNLISREEFQLPFRFAGSKDTLLVQSNGTLLYLLKKENVDFIENE